jgi:hypothetical protein
MVLGPQGRIFSVEAFPIKANDYTVRDLRIVEKVLLAKKS